MNTRAFIFLPLLIIAGIAVYALYNTSQNKKRSSAVYAKYQSQQQAVELTTDDYGYYYLTKDPSAADKYTGQLMKITGTITGFETDPDGRRFIIFNSVRCLVDKSYLSGLDKGETINILAVGAGNMFDNRPTVFEIEYYDKLQH